jgi:hypothetical protein
MLKNSPDIQSAPDLMKRAAETLERILGDVPFIALREGSVDLTTGGGPPDLSVRADTRAGSVTLVAVIKSNGQPRYARQAVNQLHRYLNQGQEVYGVFIAPYIAPASAEICRNEGIGYMDLGGNCFLSFVTVYIESKGNPNPFSRRRYLRSLYSPKAERILRVLLCDPGRSWKTEDLAREAQVSLGQVANVRKLLRDRECIAEDRVTGFRVRNPDELLEEWAGNYDFARNEIRELYSLLDLPTLENMLPNICTSLGLVYAFTGFSGAARLSPVVRYRKVTAYVSDIPKELCERLQAKEVSSGANLALVVPYDEGMFYGKAEAGGFSVVTPIQLYIDLRHSKTRGQEAADAIKQRIILKSWP